MSRERSVGAEPASAMTRGGQQREMPEQVARGARVVALATGPPSGNRLGSANSVSVRPISASVVPTDIQARRPSPVAFGGRVAAGGSRARRRRCRRVRHAGTAALDSPSPPTERNERGDQRHDERTRRAAAGSRKRRGGLSAVGTCRPYVGCALDTNLKRPSASRLAAYTTKLTLLPVAQAGDTVPLGEPGGTCRDDRHEPRSSALRRGCRAHVPAAGAGDDAARRGLHGLRGPRVGTRQLLSPAAGSARVTSSRSSERGRVPDDRGRRRERARRRRRRRPAARVPEHLPAPRRAAGRSTPEGTLRRIQCPYHAWTYGFDGSLKNAPFTEGLDGLRPQVLRAARGPARGRRGPRAARPLRRGAAAAGRTSATSRRCWPPTALPSSSAARGSSTTSTPTGRRSARTTASACTARACTRSSTASRTTSAARRSRARACGAAAR